VKRRIKSEYWTGRQLNILDRRTPECQKRRQKIGQEDTRILNMRTAKYYTGRRLNIKRMIAKHWTEE
jgi:hypothetical protein